MRTYLYLCHVCVGVGVLTLHGHCAFFKGDDARLQCRLDQVLFAATAAMRDFGTQCFASRVELTALGDRWGGIT